MSKQTVIIDQLGQELKVGDAVAFASYHNLGLTVGFITKIGRVRAHVTTDHSSPTQVAGHLNEGWTESFPGDRLIKVNLA